MKLRRLGLTLLALMGAGPVLADPPPATAPPYRPSSGALIPVAIYDAQGNIVGSFGGGGSSNAPGSREQDVRVSNPLNAATANAAITYAINGQATVGFTFTGLTASGATLTYEQSIDGGTTWTGINAINRGTGVPEATRNADGQIALSATGRTNIRVRVSTAGTGTITVASNISVREGIFSLGSPLPPGTNAIGTVAVSNPTAAGSVTPGGTNGTAAQAVQGIPNGVPQNVQLPAGATTTTGALQPPTAASGKIVATSVALTANTSTTLVAARGTPGDRISYTLQCDGTAAVGISETGGTITAATLAGGTTLVIPSGSAPLYIPPVATQTAITAYTGTAQSCRVTEYLR